MYVMYFIVGLVFIYVAAAAARVGNDRQGNPKTGSCCRKGITVIPGASQVTGTAWN